jgi:DNA primase
LFGQDGSVSAFNIVRERVSIEEVIGARAGEQAHCVAPEHPDKDPSMHNYGDHVHCFACGFHGDVTDIHAAKKGFARPIEAALDLAREYGIELPEQDPEAQRRAQRCREKEDRYQKQAKACHKALSKHEDIVDWWEGRGFDEELRKRFLLGANKEGTMAVIPYWNGGG